MSATPRDTPSGGRLLLSPFGVLASGPLWVGGLIVNEPAAFLGPEAFVAVSVVSVVGYGAMALIMLIGHAALSRLTLPEWWELLIAVGVVVLAVEVRLVVMLTGFQLADLPNDVPTHLRAVSSALLALVAFGYAGFAVDAWRRYRDERDRLLLTVVRSEERVEAHGTVTDAIDSVLRSTVHGRLAEVRPVINRELDALLSALDRGGDGRDELLRLSRVTDTRWRQISGETWRRVTADLPRAGIREFAWAFSLTRPFSLPALLLGAAAMTFFVFGRSLNPTQSAASVAVWLMLSTVTAITANATVRHLPRRALPVVALAVIGLLSFPIWLVTFGIIDLGEPELIIRIGVINLHVVLVVLLAGSSRAIARDREAVLAALRRRRDRTSLQQLQAESRLVRAAQEVAATLHGHARLSFLGAAMRLESALASGDRNAARHRIDELRRTIGEAERAVHEIDEPVTARDLDELMASWGSVCDLVVHGTWAAVPADLLPSTKTVIVEGISDALRHGDCERIEITLVSTAEGVDIEMVNDGEPVRDRVRAGLGSALLDRLAPGRWSRRVDADGHTRLSVSLRLEHHQS